MPEGVEEGIVRGIYRLSSRDVDGARGKVQLMGSGAILQSVVEAQEILAERYQVASNTWSVTSYSELARDAQGCQRWNMLHPAESPRMSYYEQAIAGEHGPFVAASDYVRAVPEQLSQFTPGGIYALGTDGMGRSESREALRRHFEVDAECVVIAALAHLKEQGKIPADEVAQAIRDLGVDPEKPNPFYA
jgi:pyruvate dehydrogenase E1 component